MTPAAITITAELRADICAHARESFPAECCGYLVGARDGAAVDGIVRCRNAQLEGEHPTAPERGAETGFVISGAELFAFAKTFEGERPARILYHSHTNGRAYFSDVDREVAAAEGGPHYPVQHLVIGVTAEGITELAQYAWSDEAGNFVEVAREGAC